MKLLACHIENFGVLSDRDYTFHDGLNPILEDNGSGKSTLAVFIKSMLFGLPKTTKRDLEENERARYSPWNGGRYGGWLDFEKGGRTYRVERFFSDKESGDSVRILDKAAGCETDNYDRDGLGRSLFGIDAAGFEKSVYFSQRQISGANPDDLYAKLTELLEEENDVGSFTKASAALEGALKIYNKNSGGDIISKTAAALSEAAKSCDEATAYLPIIARLEAQKAEKENEAKRLAQDAAAVQSAIGEALKRAAYEKYLSFESDYQTALARLNAAREAFGGQAPSEQELNAAADRLQTLGILENRLSFLAQEAQKASAKLAAYENGEQAEQIALQSLEAVFGEKPPEEEEFAEAARRYETLNRLKAEAAAVALPEKKRFFFSRFSLILLFAGLASIAAGLTAVFFAPLAGYILMPAGFLTAAAAIALSFVSAQKQTAAARKSCFDRKSALEAEAAQIRGALDAFFANFGGAPAGVSVTLMDFRAKASDFKRLEAKIAADTEAARQALEDIDSKREAAQTEANVLSETLRTYYLSHGAGEIADLREVQRALINSYSAYKSLEAQTADYKRRLDACEKPEVPDDYIENDERYDLTKLRAKETALARSLLDAQNELRRIEGEIARLSKVTDYLPEYEAETERLSRALEKHEADRKLLKKTRDLLDRARGNLTEKYLGQMKDSFNRYARAVLGNTLDLKLDGKFVYEINESGQYRKQEQFSRGLRDLFDVCAHLALTDALYKDEKPFLILDDPFKNLDDGKLKAALTLVDSLSNEYQIFYLVCHTSRLPRHK